MTYCISYTKQARKEKPKSTNVRPTSQPLWRSLLYSRRRWFPSFPRSRAVIPTIPPPARRVSIDRCSYRAMIPSITVVLWFHRLLLLPRCDCEFCYLFIFLILFSSANASFDWILLLKSDFYYVLVSITRIEEAK